MTDIAPDQDSYEHAAHTSRTRTSIEVELGGAERLYLDRIARQLGTTTSDALVMIVQTAMRLQVILGPASQTQIPDTNVHTQRREAANASKAFNWRVLLLAGAFIVGAIIAVLYLLMRHHA